MAGKYVYVKARKTKPHEGGHWSKQKHIEVATTYLATGSMELTSQQCNVPVPTIKLWRKHEWWDELVKDLQNTDNEKLDSKMTKTIDKALEAIMDRLENGDYIMDQKTGKVKQVPVKIRDATVAMNTLLDKRQLLRKLPTKIVEQSSTQHQLQELAKQFASFVTGQQPKEESLEKVVNEFIDGETVEQGEDGKYYLKET